MMRTRTLRYTLPGLGAVLSALLLACGGSTEGAPTTQPTTATIEEPTPAPREVGAAFAALPAEVTACLEEQGITVAQRGGAVDADSAADQESAIQECADQTGIELPQRADAAGRPNGGVPDQGALAECLREQGVEVELTDGATAPGGLVGSLDLEDPEVAAALEACGASPLRRGASS